MLPLVVGWIVQDSKMPPKGWAIANGIGLMAYSDGLPKSFLVSDHTVPSGMSVYLDLPDGRHFAEIDWTSLDTLPTGRPFLPSDPESSDFRAAGRFSAAITRFFDDYQVASVMAVGSRIEWSVDRFEARFAVYPDPNSDSAIGMRFYLSYDDRVVGLCYKHGPATDNAPDGWVRLDQDRLVCFIGQPWVVERDPP